MGCVFTLISAGTEDNFMQVFQVLNIREVLVDIITWTNGNLLNNDTTNPHVLLRLFRSYRVEEIETVHDSAMLLT